MICYDRMAILFEEALIVGLFIYCYRYFATYLLEVLRRLAATEAANLLERQILVSQLAYGLYASVSSGRKAASRDLRELEEVLFSLKCALDHLGEVSNDVLARPGFRYGGSGFKEKLDVMIDSCASTLQELDEVTKKYRDVESQAIKGKPRLRTMEDMKKSIRVNWQRVRWDHEKQSLQQYREKLKSHTDAINLMLTSVIWANTAFADSTSQKNHETTQSLLGNLLRNPAVDNEFRTMVQEMHAVLVKSSLEAEVLQVDMIQDAAFPRQQLGIAAYSLSSPTSGPLVEDGERMPRASLYTLSNLPYATSEAKARLEPSPGERSMQGIVRVSSSKSLPIAEYELCQDSSASHGNLSVATSKLNDQRRAFGAKEYEAFVQRHPQPKKTPRPSLLTPTILIPVSPTSQELQACIPYIFRSTVEGKQQMVELKNEIGQWTEQFSRFVIQNEAPPREKDECFLTLLRALNEAVENSSRGTRQLFYETSDSSGFATALDQVQNISKSVRVMKEIEEFEDAKEEWEKQERVR
ncbi:unnamed protein product [Alternaria alternata]